MIMSAHPKGSGKAKLLVTPDGRYFVVRGRLWRMTNPTLAEEAREQLIKQLMAARRGVRDAKRYGDIAVESEAHGAVDAAKQALGERGPVWWVDGAPDFNRHLVRNTPYAHWYVSVSATPAQATEAKAAAADADSLSPAS